MEPNRNLELNHSIELGVIEGYAVGQHVLVEIFRGATIDPGTHDVAGGVLLGEHEAPITSANENQQGSTTYDINHIGPEAPAEGFPKSDCWDTDGDGISTGTDGIPDIKPGDLMVATVLDGPGGDRTDDVDYNFIRDVAFAENGDGSITGHARGIETAGVFNANTAIVPGDPEAGGAIAMEAKRVADDPADEGEHLFEAGDIAPDGTFTNVPIGGTPGVGELFIDTVDSNGGGTGITVTFPDGTPAEVTGCGPLLSTALTSNTHRVINSANQNTAMDIGGPESGPSQVDTVTFAGQSYTVNHDGVADRWSAQIPGPDVFALAEGSHELVVTFTDGSPATTRNILKDITAPVLGADPGSGSYVGNQSVALSSNGGEAVRYTLDGSAPGGSSQLYSGTPIALGPGNHTIRAFSVDAAGNRTDETFEYAISAPQGAGGAGVGAGAGGAGAGGGGAGAGGPVVLPDPLATFRVRTLRAPGRLSLRTARRRGITARFIAPEGTQAVQASLYLNTNASSHRTRRLVKRLTRNVTGGGRLSVRFADRRTRRKLRKGIYTISVAPSSDGTNFAEGTAKRFRIR